MQQASQREQRPPLRTARDVFERVKAHLLSQDERSTVQEQPGYVSCRYRSRGPDGRALSCAVGCLIPADVPDGVLSQVEGIGMSDLRLTAEGRWTGTGTAARALAELLNGAKVPADHAVQDLLVQLQSLHDSFEPEDWPEHLDLIEEKLLGGAP